MKKVRFLDEPKEEKALKPIEFTHYFNEINGLTESKATHENPNIKEIIYLGKDNHHVDNFCVKTISNEILFYKGHLNDGVY